MAEELGSFGNWVAGGNRSRLNGHEIFWRQDGPTSGRPLTMLHGFPTSSHDWAAVVKPLSDAGFQVTTLDLLGFGASAKPRGHRFLLTEQATIVESLWRVVGTTDTALVAHDYSVSVAQELLARDADRISSVSFLNGGVYPELHRPIAIQRLLHGPAGPLLERLGSERTFAMAMRKIIGRPISTADIHSMWQAISNNDGKRVQHRLLSYIDERGAMRDRWVHAMENYTGPCQFIWGLLDPVSGAHALEVVRRNQPNRRFDVLGDVGHYPQIEASAEVTQALVGFLRDAEAGIGGSRYGR